MRAYTKSAKCAYAAAVRSIRWINLAIPRPSAADYSAVVDRGEADYRGDADGGLQTACSLFRG